VSSVERSETGVENVFGYSELILDTGDNLHFGLARLMAHSAGNSNVELVVVGDDVSVPHSRGKMVGRRCLAGITLGMSFLSCSHLDCHLSLFPAHNVPSLSLPDAILELDKADTQYARS
jgi:hypothetical protein